MRVVSRAAWPLCALTLALVAAATALGVAGQGSPLAQSHLLFVVVSALAGGLIMRGRPDHPVGWLLAAGALSFALIDACGHYALYGLPRAWPLAAAAAWPQTWLWVPANLALAALPLAFPEGAPPPRRWRPALWAIAALALVAMAAGALRPGENVQVGTPLANPLGVAAAGPVAAVTEPLMIAASGLLLLAATADLLRRARRYQGPRRRQVKWLAYAAGLATLTVAGRLAAGLTDGDPGRVWPPADSYWELVGAVGVALFPAAIGVAVLRHGLLDIDLVISRTLAYLLLSGCVTGGYLLVVASLGAGGLPVLLTGAVLLALLFAALRLSGELQRSRERLVLAREEERRRLRRDLHDGLGPTLAALAMRAQAVQDLVADPAARELLEGITADAERAIADVRRLVDGLRPPALDSLGLAGALRAQAAAGPAGGPAVTVEVTGEVTGELPALPAAVEVAAYRIAAEALTNARKHAAARRVRVRLAAHGGRLRVEVRDDGRGLPPTGPATTGVGLNSMRERAAEVGGSLVVESVPDGGTRVLATLPLTLGR